MSKKYIDMSEEELKKQKRFMAVPVLMTYFGTAIVWFYWFFKDVYKGHEFFSLMAFITLFLTISTIGGNIKIELHLARFRR